MSTLGRPDELTLHLPATNGHHVQIEQGNYDFAFYPQWGLAIAFLGHHIVAVYSVDRDAVTVGAEIEQSFRLWAKREAELANGERIALTERGRTHANVLHAMEDCSGANDRV